jgi:formyl-CoA transferase
MREVRPAERMEATPSVVRGPAPDLGQHTDEVLREAGLSAPEIESLRSDGVVP